MCCQGKGFTQPMFSWFFIGLLRKDEVAEMAGSEMVALFFFQGWDFFVADVFGISATGVETATSGNDHG